ncbi:ankyrin repeat domain-containing protein [Alkalihalobacillus sp. LMS39]|uniref:ankyrin repeat domain-containing protein n=1 Tax=Alkalihalobacillus sp. LMS39 TaxID=2924032 RepID=UPI001FB26077|nr:ankyrin repeat domain-containing protein [Alkalihalobacillus sp. LMS39]UOE93328.1 ankyrin repeat domain-containing protein [Alkalihalobacillus sp. LMS39]
MKRYLLLVVTAIFMSGCFSSNVNQTPTLTEEENAAFFAALLAGHNDEVVDWVEKGADLNQRNDLGLTPLLFTIEAEHHDTAMLLIELGANTSQEFYETGELLHLAAFWDSQDVVTYLMEHEQFDIDQPNATGSTPIILALSQGFREMAILLLDYGASVDVKNDSGWSPLHQVIVDGQMDLIELFLDRGAELHPDENGLTPLMVASLYNYPEIVSLLLGYDDNASVNATDEYGKTALMIASENGYTKIVNMLLKAGADVSIETEDGYTAEELAKLYGHEDIVEKLANNKKK